MPESTLAGAGHVGTGRVRAVLRFVVFAVVTAALLLAATAALQALPATAPLIEAAKAGKLTAAAVILLDGIGFTIVLGVTALAGRWERRPLADFGLPWSRPSVGLFGEGLLWGLGLAALTMGALWALGAVHFAPSESPATTLVLDGVVWALAFALVGLYEEFLFRGYALSELASGIGFWPAAFGLAALFGLVHLANAGETIIGGLDVMLFALFAAFTLRRTKSLWFAIGIHAAWNYALSFLFAVPGSGMNAQGQLLRSTLTGPSWLTGGTAGPEGGVIGIAVLVVALAAFARRAKIG